MCSAYFPTTDPKRYQLLGIFEFLADNSKAELFSYEGIGIATQTVDGKVFVISVYEGFPAYEAGILYGDEIVSVDSRAFHPILSFRGKQDQQVSIQIRRQKSDAPRSLEIPVELINARMMFQTALENSICVIERGNKKIGYAHIWSYAGSRYHEILKREVLWGKLSKCDGLIVDLRDGWGGASLDYVNLFREPLVEIQSTMRDGATMNFSGVWGKPVTLLVNERSTSGKELFSFAFKKLGLGEIVGTTTAGAVVAGRGNIMKNGDVLYLAGSDIRVDDQRLEGRGVEPTIEVDRPLPYAAGKDPQLEKAIELLVK